MSKIILFNKPFRVLSQFSDKEGRNTLKPFFPQHQDIYPAGRLDYDSEGLLLLTDDGRLQHQISHPNFKQQKTYWVQVEGSPSEAELEPLRLGIELNDGPCRPAKASIITEPELWQRTPPIRTRANSPTTWLEIKITEGRNRQVRRMTAALGFPTLRLVRSQIGDWKLGELKPGEYTELTVHSAQPGNKAQPKYKKKPRRHTTNRKGRL